VKRIPLSQGKIALVDDEDYEWLSQWKWYFKNGYALRCDYTSDPPKSVYMYKAILNRMGVTLTKQLRIRGTLNYRRDSLVPVLDTSCGPKNIPLSQGLCATVDPDDYSYLMQWNWSFDGKYAMRRARRESIRMHRVILERMGFSDFNTSDHRNGTCLDNRRSNLRPATFKQNGMNQTPQVGRSSQFKGVAWDKSRGRWLASIKRDGRRHYLGRFGCEKKAARAYNKAALKLHGEFARLNEVD